MVQTSDNISKTYEILRWDPILSSDSLDRHPALYVDVGNDFDQANICYFPIKIEDTHSYYDNKMAFAKLIPVGITCGHRPNFQEKTKLMAIVPDMIWQGYPMTLGKVSALIIKN